MSLLQMTQAEYDQLNPPVTTGEIRNDEKWLYVGHIPTPTTRLGWFIYNIIHGLVMRYRLLPVLVFSISDLFKPGTERETNISLPTEDELQCDYDEALDTLYIHLHGIAPHIVDWIDDRVALLRDENNDDVIGFMVEKYNKTK